METFIYMLLGLITILVLVILLIFTGIMLFKDDLVLRHKLNHRKKYYR